MPDTYETAQICLEGHVLTSALIPSTSKKFCNICGSETIHCCPECQRPIRGELKVAGIDRVGLCYELPYFCIECGKPYPWTVSMLKAAKDYVEEIELLDADEKQMFKSSLDDVIVENTRTHLAATRIRRLLNKTTPLYKEGFKQLFVGIVVEAAKRLIWP